MYASTAFYPDSRFSVKALVLSILMLLLGLIPQSNRISLSAPTISLPGAPASEADAASKARVAEQSDEWVSGNRYLDMEQLRQWEAEKSGRGQELVVLA